jgi:O-methyltransferase domain
MHDYSDPVCIDILKQIVPAMESDSKVLVAEFCFPTRASSDDLPIAAMDVGILNMGGKERSEDGFKKLFEGAGLEYVKTYRSEGGFGAIVEARLPRSG